ncbi:MAG: TMEM165/GDT1 family protein [Candidatus Fermentibacteraceae bacterium]|nr:TMEM165/GDT1 family protein [Candidatus Fermentibacteraceae bacterium]MBN2607717.1 TMEM165/GDT1 family protein [Candidatus Fermentibacteraceae bacterium]
MNIRLLLTVFSAVFIAELGDKTQIATMLFSSDREISRLTVFTAASAALVCSTLVAVLVGGSLSRLVSRRALTIAAGAVFILIGVWTLVQGIRASA